MGFYFKENKLQTCSWVDKQLEKKGEEKNGEDKQEKFCNKKTKPSNLKIEEVCPVSCGGCVVPDVVLSIVPSESPILEQSSVVPSVLPSIDLSKCQNVDSFYFKNNKLQTCSWVDKQLEKKGKEKNGEEKQEKFCN